LAEVKNLDGVTISSPATYSHYVLLLSFFVKKFKRNPARLLGRHLPHAGAFPAMAVLVRSVLPTATAAKSH
jgi:hypothetical protein